MAGFSNFNRVAPPVDRTMPMGRAPLVASMPLKDIKFCKARGFQT